MIPVGKPERLVIGGSASTQLIRYWASKLRLSVRDGSHLNMI
jgi:hypothetical protein